MAGFERGHMTNMEVDSLAAFDLAQVTNLDETAVQGIGDMVPEFNDFEIDVRKEIIGDDALLLGGVGSFEELAAQFGGAPPSAAELAELGWDAVPSVVLDSIDEDILLDQLDDVLSPEVNLEDILEKIKASTIAGG